MPKKTFFYLIFIISQVFAQSSFAAACSEQLVIMIPGFFNVPGFKAPLNFIDYYSKNVAETVEKNHRKPIILKNLIPTGDVVANSQIVLRDIQDLAVQHPGCLFDVIAHSAGGLYLASALTADPTLPLRTVVTISTPYNGAEILDLISWVPGWRTLVAWLNLEALKDFDQNKSKEMLSHLRIPQSIRWIAMAAAQKPCFLLSCSSSNKMSWLLSLGWNLGGESVGDGIVSTSSAFLDGDQLLSIDNTQKTVERWTDMVIPLEHWELVLDPESFKVLGVKDPEWIRQQQIKSYTKILERI